MKFKDIQVSDIEIDHEVQGKCMANLNLKYFENKMRCSSVFI